MARNVGGHPPARIDSKLPVVQALFSHVRWEHLAAGVSGGVVSTLVLHPLDLIKVRFQVNEGSALTLPAKRPQYSGIGDAFIKIHRTEGIRGLYKGVTPNVWGAGASWGLYFFFYNTFKTGLQGGDESVALTAPKHILAASEAGVLTLFLTNPIWVAKTRLCLQYDAAKGSAAGADVVVYRNMADCLVKTYKGEGLRGLYKGFVPGLLGVSHGALQFMAYEHLKHRYNRYQGKPPNTKFGSSEYLLFAAMSKIFAASITYPYQVLRARLQDQHSHFSGVMDVVRQTWRFEGLRGFFKGISPYLLHVTPNICIVFLIYEKVTNLDIFVEQRNAIFRRTCMLREVVPAEESRKQTEGGDTVSRNSSISNLDSENKTLSPAEPFNSPNQNLSKPSGIR